MIAFNSVSVIERFYSKVKACWSGSLANIAVKIIAIFQLIATMGFIVFGIYLIAHADRFVSAGLQRGLNATKQKQASRIRLEYQNYMDSTINFGFFLCWFAWIYFLLSILLLNAANKRCLKSCRLWLFATWCLLFTKLITLFVIVSCDKNPWIHDWGALFWWCMIFQSLTLLVVFVFTLELRREEKRKQKEKNLSFSSSSSVDASPFRIFLIK